MGTAAAEATMVTDSRYFSREFNTAIIDGPLRIYFADQQESEALKIYFDIQELLFTQGLRLDAVPMTKPHIFLMLYPTPQIFKDVFDETESLALGQFGENVVLGVNGPYNESTRKLIGSKIKDVFIEANVKLANTQP